MNLLDLADYIRLARHARRLGLRDAARLHLTKAREIRAQLS